MRAACGLALFIWAGLAQADALQVQLQQVKSEFAQAAQQLRITPAAEDRLLLGYTEKTTISLERIELSLNGSRIHTHQYSIQDNAALKQGGLQTLTALKLPAGRHQLTLKYTGTTPDGTTFAEQEQFTVSKSGSAKTLQLTLKNKRNKTPSLAVREI